MFAVRTPRTPPYRIIFIDRALRVQKRNLLKLRPDSGSKVRPHSESRVRSTGIESETNWHRESTGLDCGDNVHHLLRLVPRRAETLNKEVRFGTPNVCGGMDDKIDDIGELMKDIRLDIICVTETKRKGMYTPNMFKSFEERERFLADVRDILVNCDRNESINILASVYKRSLHKSNRHWRDFRPVRAQHFFLLLLRQKVLQKIILTKLAKADGGKTQENGNFPSLLFPVAPSLPRGAPACPPGGGQPPERALGLHGKDFFKSVTMTGAVPWFTFALF
ncbi:hypothetical protein EVAR_14589_1 [Eumeta japonica]|uniref:Uncharacterized protein n=1 Tax=Eumeta variegata TaxID=151549 RepID=A0A4C1UUC0_EUMVA|nr:hypothetical protein EVAR_14589_1 [Eumeta japonica]